MLKTNKEKTNQIYKFISISFISFIIDYILYTLTLLITNNINISNIVARLTSATFNYNLNKNVVFKYKNKTYKTIVEYILLAVSILIINTVLLNIIVYIGINKYISKIIVELILFIASFIIQKYIIFKKEDSYEK